MRVAFDLDDTLLSARGPFLTERPSGLLLPWLTPEHLRAGSSGLLQEIISAGHEVWIYTTSLRPVWFIHLIFRAYGVSLSGVVNHRVHAQHVNTPVGSMRTPSKFPPAFGIDVLIDDSAGVEMEGEREGFRVIRVLPSDEGWSEMVRAELELGQTRNRSKGI